MDIFMRGVVPICLSSSAKASWFASSSLSSHVWSVYQLVHPANLVSCSAHRCVGDLPHLPAQGRSPSLEVCSLPVYLSLGFLWGNGIGMGQICHPSPSWVSVKCYNFMNCANLTVLTRMKHPHGLVTMDFNVSV